MELVIVGVVTFLNLIILKIKFEAGRTADLIIDIGAIVVLNYFFAGTLGGMIVAMVASLLMSIYLWFSPPKIVW
jgi:hypothetical protein